MKKIGLALAVFALYLIFPPSISAHAFGQLYNLPVPFWLYLYGGACALIVSFLAVGYFLNQTRVDFTYPRLSLFKISSPKQLALFLKIASISFLILTIATGIFGTDSPYLNFNMTFFWIIFLLGFTYLVALIGNLWPLINPINILVRTVERLKGNEFNGIFKYPPRLNYWPALIFYFLTIWFELIGGTTPAKLSVLVIVYTIISLSGVVAIGKKNWFFYCDFFSVFFRLIAKVSPLEVISGTIYLRPPFVGLLKNRASNFSLLIFILFILSSTAFDGFSSTIPWLKVANPLESSIEVFFPNNAHLTFQVIKTIGLVISLLVFLYIYLALVSITKIITNSKQTIFNLALQFAFTLIPIALVYNIAHYYTLLLTEGQNIIRLISDPFGFGWNLFKTTNFEPNIGIVGANFVWHSQVVVMLVGHIAAVFLAHIVALKIFPSHRTALISQIPMLALMVIYTMVGLWILSQPLTTGF